MFEKYSNIKFHEDKSSGIRRIPCGWTEGQTHMKKLIIASRNFPNALKNFILFYLELRTC